MTNRHRLRATPTPVLRFVLACGTMPSAMTAWLSVLVPLLIMFFALGMERVERRLRDTTVRQEELDDFLEHAQPDEVRALFRQGTTRALELFRLRSRTPRSGSEVTRTKIAS